MKISLKFTRRLICIWLVLSLSMPAFADFQPIRNYDNAFSDVYESDWYYGYVAIAYQLNLVNGTSDGIFSPNGPITLAETVTLAARLHAIYTTGEANFVQGDVWYQVYVDYATQMGIIDSGAYATYDAPATRTQFATILAHALPAEALSPIQTISALPDVTASSPGYAEILTLYNAGVLTGSDERGSFYPDSQIRRCEVSTIITRMAMPVYRVTSNIRDTVTVYAEDGRSVEIASSDLQAWLDVGWYAYPVTWMYRTGNRSILIPASEEEAYLAQGWYPYPVMLVSFLHGTIYRIRVSDWPSYEAKGYTISPWQTLPLDWYLSYAVTTYDMQYTDTGAQHEGLCISYNNGWLSFALRPGDTRPIYHVSSAPSCDSPDLLIYTNAYRDDDPAGYGQLREPSADIYYYPDSGILEIHYFDENTAEVYHLDTE